MTALILTITIYVILTTLMAIGFRYVRFAYVIHTALLLMICYLLYLLHPDMFMELLGYWLLPFIFINSLLYVKIHPIWEHPKTERKYAVKLKVKQGAIKLQNIRRGISVIGSAGSGKTESVVYNILKHFQNHQFCGLIHDYKHFEITEIAVPLFNDPKRPFHIVSFDDIYSKVNPIAPRYMEDEESVNEVSRVLLENLLEQRESIASGSTDSLIDFLSSDYTSKAMADAFISGRDSERQTAAVMSTLANALKKISTQRIFMTLSADEVSLDINNPKNSAVVSIVNNPKFETTYSPVIATIIHTITKQMSIRHRESSFILIEEAPTIRLLNMHRIPATLRSYDISTVYVMQDKTQNDMMYGDKASRAILSNLSYQFFGKANDPDTAKYYERFFEIVKKPTTTISKSQNSLDFDSRISTGEKEVSKIRSDVFFRLKQGEFISFADGKDRKVQFKMPKITRDLPPPIHRYNDAEIQANFERIHLEVRKLFELKS